MYYDAFMLLIDVVTKYDYTCLSVIMFMTYLLQNEVVSVVLGGSIGSMQTQVSIRG